MKLPALPALALLAFGALLCSASAYGQKAERPLMRDFIGLNGHTVQFKPDLYRPVTQVVRDYHPVVWDIENDTSYAPPFPFAKNQVNWEGVYGSWKKLGYDVDACLMFDQVPADSWKDLPGDAYAYGFMFARHFGPSGARKLVSSVEIGNEPGKYPDETYKSLFVNAAKGIRKADPKLLIATCNVEAGPNTDYSKNIDLFKDLGDDYDIINTHDYAFAEQYPTWRRSYPEDPSIPYLKQIRNLIAWRDQNAPKKPIWITEFGWDATTQPNEKEGDFKGWVGVTDAQQAQYLVRSFLVFSAMDVGRAYIYFFNDDDQARLHASSGLTRKWVPKPSFYAVAHLQKTLGDFRFSRKVAEKAGDSYVYEYSRESDPTRKVWVAWSPTGKGATKTISLSGLPGAIVKAERMPLAAGDAKAEDLQPKSGTLKVEIEESPLYIEFKAEK